ncbi:MAG: nuclear export factor [Gemmatimonadetes bacterium]|nr:nuclear export factor [Gemmatimonadota bacterium]
MTILSLLRRGAPLGARRVAFGCLCAIGLTFMTASVANAHAVVFPKVSKVGGHEKYVLRVPNEKNIPTLRVEIRFPTGLRVTAFEDVPGWQLEVLTDSAKHVIGAVWTGTLQPQRFVEFPFVAANPKEAVKLVWPAFQTYADGQRVEWTGAEGSKSPASATNVGSGDAAAGGADGLTRWLPWLALLIAVLSLGLALRKPEQRVVATTV